MVTGAASGGDVLLLAEGVVKDYAAGSSPARRRPRPAPAVNGVSLTLRRGETLGLVGESGCGKTTLARCLIRLHDMTAGTVTFDGVDISTLSQRQLRPLRRRMQMVFQDPYSSLNPRRRVGAIIADPIVTHREGDPTTVKSRVQELMDRVGLNPEHYNRFPADFSGGQRQRIGIARAIALNPDLVVCDEPVSALDVSIQAQILNLLTELQRDLGLTYLFVSHDLNVVRQVSDRVAVMHAGRIVESASAHELFTTPRHPYTAALLRASRSVLAAPTVLEPFGDDDPGGAAAGSGCSFASRCGHRSGACEQSPPLVRIDARALACHHPLPAARVAVALSEVQR